VLRRSAALATITISAVVLSACSGSDTSPPLGAPEPSTTETGLLNPWANKERVNLLILGSDGGPNRTGERTDTMIVASADTRTGNTVLIGLPRNVENVEFKPGTPMAERFPDGFPDFAFGIFTYAEAHPEVMPGSEAPGAELLMETIGHNLGLTIDNYALVNMQGFRDIVDAFGGLAIRVTKNLPAGSRWLEPGLYQDMTGADALWYARSRENTSDYDRMERQRCVLAAIVRQVDAQVIVDTLPALMAAGTDSLRTDISAVQLPAVVLLAKKVAGAEIMGITLGPPLLSGAHPDWDVAKAAVADAIATSARAERDPNRPRTEAQSGELQSLDSVCQFA
jgi:polyisoprenyl-teichoic acid--peptidoglycan teichoic acid transferase